MAVAVPLRFWLVAVIVADPAAMPVMRPLVLTVATAGLVLDHVTLTATLSPACVRPYATNCRVSYGFSVTLSGTMTTCTTALFGGVGAVLRTGNSHAASAAATTRRGFMRARRTESLNVNGIAPTPPNTKGPPASTRGRFAGGPADLASSGSP